MDWNKIHFGKLNKQDILKYVQNETWQKVRRSMKGTSLDIKYTTLQHWLVTNNYSNESKIQVTNYVNALKRGGLL